MEEKFVPFNEQNHNDAGHSSRPDDFMFIEPLDYELQPKDRDYAKYLIRYDRYSRHDRYLKNKERLSEVEYVKLIDEYAVLQKELLKDGKYESQRGSRMTHIRLNCLLG